MKERSSRPSDHELPGTDPHHYDDVSAADMDILRKQAVGALRGGREMSNLELARTRGRRSRGHYDGGVNLHRRVRKGVIVERYASASGTEDRWISYHPATRTAASNVDRNAPRTQRPGISVDHFSRQ